jgi:hypothetical protein
LIVSERMAALGTMAGMLAHDFRGPMTVIRGYAETLVETGLPAAEVAARAALIVQSVDRLERMTAETLDFARGSGRLARRQVALPALLNELAEGLAAELPGLEVTREFRVPPGASAALDVDKLRRAVGNIAANALDAMGGKGRLHLRAALEPGAGNEGGSRLVLTLADEGPGVAEEVRERVFQPFATFGKKKGTGLGLAVSRRFVEDHGGSLELLPPPPLLSMARASRSRFPWDRRRWLRLSGYKIPSMRPGLALVLLGVLGACRTPDPHAELEILDVETYWAVDAPRGNTQYIAPVVRFRLRNKSPNPERPIQARADFRRAGEKEEPWASGFLQVTTAQKPLLPGQEVLVVLKSEGHYSSSGTPESMLQNQAFRDALARIYLRAGSSDMVRMGADYKVERRIGSRSVQDIAAP